MVVPVYRRYVPTGNTGNMATTGVNPITATTFTVCPRLCHANTSAVGLLKVWF